MKAKFFPNLVVWGEEYVSSLLTITLPTLLAAGNLQALASSTGSEFLIACPSDEEQTIKNSREYVSLTELIPVRFLRLAPNGPSDAMLKMSAGHKQIVDYIAGQEGYAIFLSPDCVLSSHSISYLVDAAASGMHLVSAPGFRLSGELVSTELRERAIEGRLNLSGRDLVRLLHKHSQHEVGRYFISSDTFTPHPHYLLWRLQGGNDFVGRAFHLHPILLKIPPGRDLSILDRDTIDGDFVGRIIGDYSKIRVVADSDHLAIFSLSSSSTSAAEEIPHQFDPHHVAIWSFCTNNNAIHRHYLTQHFVIHAHDVDCAEVERVACTSGLLTHDILSHPAPFKFVGYDKSDSLPEREAQILPLPMTDAPTLVRELLRRIWPLSVPRVRRFARGLIGQARRNSTVAAEAAKLEMLRDEMECIRAEIRSVLREENAKLAQKLERFFDKPG